MKKIFTILLLLVTVSAFAQTAQWTFVSYLPAPNPPVNSITVPNANTVWVVCDASGGAARVYKSTNGGVNWLLRNGGLPAVNGYGIFAFDTTTAIVGNTNGSLYKTTNGGFNWTNVLTVTNSFSNGVHMFNANYGIYLTQQVMELLTSSELLLTAEIHGILHQQHLLHQMNSEL